LAGLFVYIGPSSLVSLNNSDNWTPNQPTKTVYVEEE
jgi:hypothetical protein